MTATLKFNLPEESEEFHMATDAPKAFAALNEFQMWLRNTYKHADLDRKESELLENIKTAFFEAAEGLLE